MRRSPTARLAPTAHRRRRAAPAEGAEMAVSAGRRRPRPHPPAAAARARTSSSSSARPAISPGRKLIPGLFHLAQAGLLPGVPHRRHVARRARRRALPQLRPRGAARVLPRHGRRRRAGGVRGRLSLRRRQRRPDALAGGVARAEDASSAGTPRRLHYLSVPPAAARRSCATLGEAGLVERARIIMEKPFGTDLAQREGAQRARCTRSSPRSRSSASTTSSARRRRSTSWRFRFANGLFEPIWNRKHIDHVQIDVPETLVDRHARRRSTRRPARSATWSSRTSSRCSRSWRWSRRPSLEPRRDRRGEEQGVPLAAAARPDAGRARPVRGLPRRAGRRARLRDRDVRRAARARSTTGAGPACRSTCAPASAWPRARASSRSRSASRPSRCSPPARASASPGRTTSRSTSPTRRGSRCRSTASGPAPACGSTSSSMQFSLRRDRRAQATCSRPTSA